MRALVSAAPLLCFLVACGAAPPDAVPPATAPRVDVAKGGNASPDDDGPAALRELSLRVAPGQSLAYRVKTRSEQPGRKVEQDSVVFLDAWGDGTVVVVNRTGDHERSAYEGMRGELLPLPEGAQSTYTKQRGPSPGGADDDTVTERFDRRPVPGGQEEITFHTEKKRAHAEDVVDGAGTFDVGAMRYVHVHMTRTRRVTPRPGGKPVPPQMREIRVDVDVVYDAAAADERTKQRAALRTITLRAAQDPAGTANPAADLAALLSGQTQDFGTLDFFAHGHPELVWRAALAATAAPDALQRISMETRVPDAVLAEVRAALRRSPNHPIAAMVVGARDARLLPELSLIARKHEDPELRQAASEAEKGLKRAAVPLATRLRAAKPGKQPPLYEDFALNLEPDRDKKALFEYVLAALPAASQAERDMYFRALADLANVDLGDRDEAWKQFWSTHQNKPYDEWLFEALAGDGPAWTRAHAAERIGQRPPTDAAKKALRAALEDKSLEVRNEAARALAVFKDEAAIRPLLRSLPDDTQRYAALMALSYFSDSDFGLKPMSDAQTPEETAAALGRWLGWAKRRGVDPGFP